MNAIAHKPFLGYSITTTSLKALEEEPNIVKNLDRDTYILDRIKIETVNIRNKNGITSEDKEDIENIFKELIINKLTCS